jgi:hypothetical protein
MILDNENLGVVVIEPEKIRNKNSERFARNPALLAPTDIWVA